RGLAVERLDRIGVALLLERVFGIFVVRGGERRRYVQMAKPDRRDQACSRQDQAARHRKTASSHCKKSPEESQRLQEVDDGTDLLLGQNSISPEWRHHGRRIALGLIAHDRDQIVAIGVFALQAGESRPDRSRKIAAVDLVTAEAIALASIEGELLP